MHVLFPLVIALVVGLLAGIQCASATGPRV
jgi:hypothetical protein